MKKFNKIWRITLTTIAILIAIGAIKYNIYHLFTALLVLLLGWSNWEKEEEK